MQHPDERTIYPFLIKSIDSESLYAYAFYEYIYWLAPNFSVRVFWPKDEHYWKWFGSVDFSPYSALFRKVAIWNNIAELRLGQIPFGM